MKSYEQLLKNNKEWSAEAIKNDPDVFKRLSEVQSPEFLWIGCSDSRVPADRITGTQPGEPIWWCIQILIYWQF
jgi:carbonic anhydrase